MMQQMYMNQLYYAQYAYSMNMMAAMNQLKLLQNVNKLDGNNK